MANHERFRAIPDELLEAAVSQSAQACLVLPDVDAAEGAVLAIASAVYPQAEQTLPYLGRQLHNARMQFMGQHQRPPKRVRAVIGDSVALMIDTPPDGTVSIVADGGTAAKATSFAYQVAASAQRPLHALERHVRLTFPGHEHAQVYLDRHGLDVPDAAPFARDQAFQVVVQAAQRIQHDLSALHGLRNEFAAAQPDQKASLVVRALALLRDAGRDVPLSVTFGGGASAKDRRQHPLVRSRQLTLPVTARRSLAGVTSSHTLDISGTYDANWDSFEPLARAHPNLRTTYAPLRNARFTEAAFGSALNAQVSALIMQPYVPVAPTAVYRQWAQPDQEFNYAIRVHDTTTEG